MLDHNEQEIINLACRADGHEYDMASLKKRLKTIEAMVVSTDIIDINAHRLAKQSQNKALDFGEELKNLRKELGRVKTLARALLSTQEAILNLIDRKTS